MRGWRHADRPNAPRQTRTHAQCTYYRGFRRNTPSVLQVSFRNPMRTAGKVLLARGGAVHPAAVRLPGDRSIGKSSVIR